MSIETSQEDGADIFWPGYVDAIANLVLNLLFMLTIMIVAAVSYTHLDVYKRQTLAHQNFDQISQDGNNHLLNALLGNVGTQFIFRVGRKEATLLEDNFYPHFNASTLTQLPDWHAIAGLLVNNKPSSPFVFHTDTPKL